LHEELLVNILILLVSLVVLNEASHIAITNAVRTADITGLRRTTVGFILIGFSTSLPELCVSVISSIFGETYIGVAIGNVLGSNITNTCLILGAALFLAAIRREKSREVFPFIIREETESLYFTLFVSSIIPLSLMYVGYASRFVGIILILVFILYAYQLSKRRRPREEGSLGEQRQKLRRYGLLTILGVGGVVVSSYFIVNSAAYIATEVRLPQVFVGAIVIALGTSLPELSTSLKAVFQGHLEIAFGNVAGSCFINVTLILGATLAVSPISTINMNIVRDLIVFSLLANLFLWYFLCNEKMWWREAAILLFIYALFLATTFGAL